MSNEHQPGNPGVDLSEIDAAFKVSTLDPRPSAQGRWMTVVAGAWPAIAAELRTLRARVGELEKCLNGLHLFAGRGDGHETAGKVTDCIAGVIIQLRADLEKAEARAESAEARIAALEKLFDDAGQGEHNVLALIDHYQSEAMAESEARRAALSRVGELECAEADLEFQLAAAREEQGLEALVRSTLKERNDSLLVRFETPWWKAEWRSESRSVYGHARRNAQGATLPALLRAILEVEAKGG